MMKKCEQRGVALLFALGMLTILLVTGMAFVANALTAQKVAANNSARTQARMFAQSALSRAMASVMIYQYQYFARNSSFPESFAHIHSTTDNNTGREGLLTDTAAESLMNLPEDDTVVARNLAKEFNNLFLNNRWEGDWVLFYDNTSSSDRQIIGRAAWQVLSTSPQILAPVFLSGHLRTDGSYNWNPRNHRWGREIDEVYLDPSARVFGKAGSKISEASKFQDFEQIYNALELASNEDKRFIDKWLSPDVDGESIMDPTPIVPETYYYQESANGKKIQVLRFNISEIADVTKYGMSDNSDPWYARFGVNSLSAATGMNDTKAIENLTREGAEFQSGDEYDSDLPTDDRPSLPFLRRIGNESEDSPTFKDDGGNADLDSWRKQIAANFNDYCDADSIPTSDKSARDWMNALPTENVDTFHPKFTGNEKTPYLYELGFRLGFFNATTTGFALPDSNAEEIAGSYSTDVDLGKSEIAVEPIVKLANIYNFDPAGFGDFTAGIDLGELEVKVKPTEVNLTVEYTPAGGDVPATKPLSGVKTVVKNGSAGDYDLTMEFTGTVNDGVFGDQTVTIAGTRLDNTGGANPYPILIPAIDNANVKKVKFNSGKVTFKITATDLNKIDNSIPKDATINSIKLNKINKFELIGVKLNVKRAYLAAQINSQNTGLDYVKTLPEIEWTKPESSSLETAAEITSKCPGFYIGGIRNFDPRQNLNPGDWTTSLRVCKSENILIPAEDDELTNAMNVGAAIAAGQSAVEVRQGTANTNTVTEINNKHLANFDDDKQDLERTSGPGWSGDANTTRLSTAFIRNAPMMSPWEIGFIHRGIRWQTLNIKNACDPDDNSKSVALTGHRPVSGWGNPGTSYEGGDGGILDQIKMTEQCATYGKININKLRDDYPEYEELDKEIIRALFSNISRGQSVLNFYTNSKRDAATDNFPEANDNGIAITYGDTGSIADNIVAARSTLPGAGNRATSRAQFLDYTNGSCDLSNAFTGTNGATDAAQEEVIGKTINLLNAEPSTPNQIQMVIVAQSIRDVGGTQYRKVTDPGVYSGSGVNTDAATGSIYKNCSFGQFDLAESSNGYKDNIYFDEITGEVKMFVTIDRDINTGRMTVRRIDYLE